MDDIIESDNRGNYKINLCESPFVEIETPTPASETKDEIVDSIHADNQEYLNHFIEPLFLEDDDDSKVTLASMYVSPHLKNKDENVAACIMDWFKATTRTTCMLLFGNAGIGKSSLVSKIVADANNETQNKEFPFNADQVLAVALRNHCDEIDMTKKADEILTSLFSGYAKQQLKSKLLILDGLDEVCVLCKDFDGYIFLKKLAQLERGFHVLVTSREATNYFSDPKDIQDLRTETLQWTIPETETWCSKYCKAKEDRKQWCTQFIEDYRNLEENDNDYRKEAFCVPIILYICGESEINLSDHNNIGSIYGNAFRKILLRAHLRGHGDYTDLTEADKMSNLIAWQYTKEIAYQMFLLDTLDLAESDDPDNRYAIGLKKAKARTKSVLKEKYGFEFNVPDDALEIKKELALCPFTKTNGSGGITFAHKTVYEYFTAVKLYEDYFAKFNYRYFEKNYNANGELSEKGIQEVANSFIQTFRYSSIEAEIFQYLCEILTENDEFDFQLFSKAIIAIINQYYFSDFDMPKRIEEYITPINRGYTISSQLNLAFCNLTWLLTGCGYTNTDGIRISIKDLSDSIYQSVNMQRWSLANADLSYAHLTNAKLAGAKLTFANLTGAHLTKAHLTKADLTGADLSGAHLTKADLTGADLSGAHLSDAHLSDADLTGADLPGADLRGANLSGANLSGAILTRADLTNAKLTGAHLTYADLTGAHLTDAVLSNAYLTGAILFNANLTNAYLTGAHLTNAKLTRANLTRAHLSDAQLTNVKLTGADLTGADLTGADLTKANLTNADLTYAHLTRADLTYANLTRADLTRADLTGANLTRANLTRADLTKAKYCKDPEYLTLFPEGFDPATHGMIEVDRYGNPVTKDTDQS